MTVGVSNVPLVCSHIRALALHGLGKTLIPLSPGHVTACGLSLSANEKESESAVQLVNEYEWPR